MDLNEQQLLELAQYAFIRLDGAWFLALAKKFGVETAWEMDVETWKSFSYIFGKRIRKEMSSEPEWPGDFISALEILSRLLGIKGREISTSGDSVTVRVTECETQKAIAKAGIADCGIATVASYTGVARGLFGKEADVSVRHTGNLNHGDPCCEVVVSMVR